MYVYSILNSDIYFILGSTVYGMLIEPYRFDLPGVCVYIYVILDRYCLCAETIDLRSES